MRKTEECAKNKADEFSEKLKNIEPQTKNVCTLMKQSVY